MLDRIVWFLRNVDLAKGLADVVAHYRDGIAAVDGRPRRRAVGPGSARRARARRQELDASRRARRARRPASPISRPLAAAPDIVLVADRTGKPIGEVAATYFAAGAFFRLDRIASAARTIPIADYFDRLALDRARDSIGDAERRLTAAMVRQWRRRRRRGRGLGGAAQKRGRADPRRDSRNRRFRPDAVEASVAASLLGDLVKELRLFAAAVRRKFGRGHKKEPQADTRLGFLSCCLNLGLLGRGRRGVGGWGSRPAGLNGSENRSTSLQMQCGSRVSVIVLQSIDAGILRRHAKQQISQVISACGNFTASRGRLGQTVAMQVGAMDVEPGLGAFMIRAKPLHQRARTWRSDSSRRDARLRARRDNRALCSAPE